MSNKATAVESPFLAACHGGFHKHVPVWLMRQAGRYMVEYRELREKVSFLELCSSPDLIAEVTLHACDKIHADAAILFADILLIPDAIGQKLSFVKGMGPRLESPVRSLADVEALKPFETGMLSHIYDGVRLIRQGLPEDKSLIGFAGAPFTVASYMVEGGPSKNFLHMKRMILEEPQAWSSLMERLTVATIDYLEAQVSAGADAVQLFDSWVGCLSADWYRAYVKPYVKRIVSVFKGRVPVILFGKGTSHLLEDFAETGCDVMGVDYVTSMKDVRRRFPDLVLQGNLDPAVLYADRDTIKREVVKILDDIGSFEGFIFNLGHGILPTTPVDNAIYLVDLVHELTQS